jgi:sodium/hydrogen exchanger 8
MSISLFACFGTAISTMVVALSLEMAKQFDLTGGFEPTFTELLTFGALISATDPVSTLAVFQAKQVDPQLFYLVFGESVLNDAVGLVLFETLSKFVGKENDAGDMTEEITEFLMDFFVNFTGSMVFGVLAGIMAAYFLKKVDMRQTKLLELSLFFLIMYLPFFAAELVELSGIVTILFTGITAKRYASHNLSETTEENVDSLFRVIAHLAETSIFLELGLSIFGLSSEFFEWRFVTWAILACLLGRGCNVYPLRLLYNFFLANETVTKRTTSCLQLPEIEEPRKKSPKSDLASKLHDDDYGISYSIESIAAVSVDYSELKTAPTDQTETPAYRKDLKIRNNTAHMLFFSGLRGAVAYR